MFRYKDRMFRTSENAKNAKAALVRVINEQMNADGTSYTAAVNNNTEAAAPDVRETFGQKLKRIRLEKDVEVSPALLLILLVLTLSFPR